MTRALVVAGLVAALAGVVDAKPKKRPKTATAARVTNMPRGFAWPPSPAMLEAAQVCERDLRQAEVPFEKAEREGRIVDAIVIAGGQLGGIAYTSVFRKGPQKLDCQLARALEQIGPQLYALGVREVKFGSIYRWSNVRVGGKTKPYLSRHALGLAMDVVSFVDADGREANVRRDYKSGNALLLAIEQLIDHADGFRLVLTPKNDPISHSDHFHLEANPRYDRPAS